MRSRRPRAATSLPPVGRDASLGAGGRAGPAPHPRRAGARDRALAGGVAGGPGGLPGRAVSTVRDGERGGARGAATARPGAIPGPGPSTGLGMERDRPAPPRPRRRRRALLLVVLLVVVFAGVAGGAAAYLYLPTASIVLTIRPTALTPVAFVVTADPTRDRCELGRRGRAGDDRGHPARGERDLPVHRQARRPGCRGRERAMAELRPDAFLHDPAGHARPHAGRRRLRDLGSALPAGRDPERAQDHLPGPDRRHHRDEAGSNRQRRRWHDHRDPGGVQLAS